MVEKPSKNLSPGVTKVLANGCPRCFGIPFPQDRQDTLVLMESPGGSLIGSAVQGMGYQNVAAQVREDLREMPVACAVDDDLMEAVV